jgi:hypothetical protein
MGKTVWYIKPKSGHTSEVIGRVTGDEDVCYDVLCADRRRRDLYRCSDWGALETALGSAENIYLHFNVWKQEGTSLPRRFNPAIFSGRNSKNFRTIAEKLQKQLNAQLSRKGTTAHH